jgi:penicillin-binding protein 1A
MSAGRGRAATALAALALLAGACHVPDLSQAESQAHPLAQTSFLYASDGSLITTLHAGQNRVVVPFGQIPEDVRNAVVAVEDRRFYQHGGIDVKAIVRAAYADVSAGRIVEGGSTITQQYVKNTLVGNDQTLSRKVREAELAVQVENRYTKDQILTKYLNTVYFGEGAYGIQAAAQTFFGKPAKELTLADASLLAGLISAPATFDPAVHPRAAIVRRTFVLSEMRSQGMIGRQDYRRANDRPLGLDLRPGSGRYIAPYFVNYVKRWFLSNPRFGATYQQRYNLLFKGGLRIQTTIDPKLQRDAEYAVNQILTYPSDPYGAMTVIDPRTGYIKAMVGGRDYFSTTDPEAQVNLATGAGGTGRQAGSAFKPFTLVTALENGISPNKVYPAPSSITIPVPHGKPYPISNFSDSSYSGSLSVVQATIHSVNTVYAQIERDIGDGNIQRGAERMVQVAHAMGIQSHLDAYPSAVLGSNSVNTLEMASAIGTLAAGGYHSAPTGVSEITTAEGAILYKADSTPERVVPPAVASIAAGVLAKVVQQPDGTGYGADIGRPQFGKTGTAQELHDAWFVGAIPQLTAAVWVGFPQGQIAMVPPRTRIPVLGGTWPASIWKVFMLRATRGMKVESFPKAKTRYVTVAVDATQNCLANRYTPPDHIQRKKFIAGTQPKQKCDRPSSFQSLDVPSVVGLSESAATKVVRRAGFKVAVEEQASASPVGTVLSQDPQGTERAPQQSTVTLTVALQAPTPTPTPTPTPAPTATITPGTTTVPVPDVVGRSRYDAIRRLRQLGFATTAIVARCDLGPASCDPRSGHVWRVTPSPGEMIAPGSAVVIRVNP